MAALTTTRTGTLVLLGAALCLGFSSILVEAADSEPATVAMLRAGLAAIMLLPVAVVELRRRGRPPRRQILFAAAAGIALGLDFSCWNISIAGAGAGIATVLINVQIVVMPLLVFAVDRVRPRRSTRFLAPLMLVGVALAGGLLSPGSGTAPSAVGVLAGVVAGVGYTIYLFLIRRGSTDQNHWPTTVLTVACTSAAATAALIGAATGTLRMPGTPRSWLLIVLLAFAGQVLAFALINKGVTLLPTHVSGVLLLLPSAFALPLAALFLDQVPSTTQILGCLLILAGATFVARSRPPYPADDQRATAAAKPSG